MKTLYYIEIPKLFTGVQLQDRHDPKEVQYCVECATVFQTAWQTEYKARNAIWHGRSFNCPHCLTAHRDNICRTLVDKKDHPGTPISMTVKLIQYKHTIVLVVIGEKVYLPADNRPHTTKFCERIVFDIKTKSVIYHPRKGESQELESFLTSELFSDSALSFLTKASLAWKQKQQFMQLSKKLRACIAKMYKEIHGYGPEASFVQPDVRGGLLVPQIINLAWRMASPDAPNINIPSATRWGESNTRWIEPLLGIASTVFHSHHIASNYLNEVMVNARTGLSYPQSVLKALKLPDCKAYRAAVAKTEDAFLVRMLKNSHDLSVGVKEAITLYKLIGAKPYFSYVANTETFRMLLGFKKTFGATTVAEFLRHSMRPGETSQVRDCLLMIKQLDDNSKTVFEASKMHGSKLHDVLAKIHRAQLDADYDLKVPEHVVKRLTMQLACVKFYLPGTRYELENVGEKLHNCVKSYSKNVLQQRCQIVAMTDENGKLTACLEIENDTIVQAKLNQNKSVKHNFEVNQAILEWAKKANLKISTVDISTERPEAVAV